ncbi:MAG: MSMEG_4193 family putative phosphomutase [Acidimicrobiales bacterium]
MPARPKPPKPTTIAFVRHGRTPTTGKVLPGRARGLHLAEEGKVQAQAAAHRVAAYAKVAAVYASPLERTRETAAPIAKALGLRVVADRGLVECDFGAWTGRELKELYKLPEWQQVQRTPSQFRFPEGESFLEMQARLSEAVRRIVAAHPGEIVVCVSHADPIKVLVADAMGSHLDHFQRFDVSPCSITVIAYSATGPSVLCVNSTSTLPGAT